MPKCPLFRKPCLKHDCEWYIHVIGKHPQTGGDLDHWGCAMTWMPVLTIENSQQQRQTAASVDKLHNGLESSLRRRDMIDMVNIRSRMEPFSDEPKRIGDITQSNGD